jgi:fucose 4-O-acetylase-like acetyltransferase
MNNSSRKRNNILDIVKGFAIINIILIHTVFWSGKSYIPYQTLRELTLLVDVPLFFFLSGWAASLHKQDLKGTFKRLKKLYIPYLVMIVVLLLSSLIFYNTRESFDTVLKWLTFTSHRSLEFRVVMGSMWFLAPFIIISVFTPLYTFILKNRKISILFIMFLLCINVIFNLATFKLPNISILGMTSLRIVVFYLFFYFLGMYTRDIKLTFKQLIYVLSPIIILFVYYLWKANFKFELQANKFPPNIFYLISSMFSVIATLYLKNFEGWVNKHIKNSKLLKFLSFSGQNVYNIYLYQGFGGSLIFLLVNSSLKNQIHWSLLLLLCFICNLLISYILAYVFGLLNKAILGIKFRKEGEVLSKIM